MAITQPALARAMARDVVRAAPPEAGIKRIRVWTGHGHIDPEREYVEVFVLAEPATGQTEQALLDVINKLAQLYPDVNIGAGLLASRMPGGTDPEDWVHPGAEELDPACL
jgi:hypothetical protein